MNNPASPKERNLLKGSMRRVFARSELRRAALERNAIEHSDPKRPRVTKWVWCDCCGEVFPRYLAQVDHIMPLVPLDKTLEDMSWDEVVDRLWCSIDNLSVLQLTCHKQKSKIERVERSKLKKQRSQK